LFVVFFVSVSILKRTVQRVQERERGREFKRERVQERRMRKEDSRFLGWIGERRRKRRLLLEACKRTERTTSI